jgi:peptidyl-prolyl cis-trans isomerase D
MTMLDRMRRHKNWLKWSLAIVVVAFILLYIPNFLDSQANGTGNANVVATVEGHDITVTQYRRAYQQQLQQVRQSYGSNIDENMLRQLGMDRRILQQMIDEEAAVAEARRLGITATDAEVRERILAQPVFQENGQFIGDVRYRQLLASADPPMRPNEFEEQVRRGILLSKLQSALTDWVTITDAEVDAEYRRRNEKVTLEVASFPADRFRAETTASDAEIDAYFKEHTADYRIPDKRKVKYALIDAQAIRNRTQVTPADVQQYYEQNQQQYSTPEQVHAQHILFKTEGKDDDAVRKEAEAVLAKAKAGADFSKLASQYSEDEGSKAKGGDLDFFGRGAMVPEFDQAVFAMEPGQISDLVKTQFGYHIIKLIEKRPATTRPLDEVRAQIEDQLKSQRAEEEADRQSQDLANVLKTPADLDTIAKERGLTVGESEFFAADEPISGLGLAPAVASQAFTLADGVVSPPIRTPQGFVFVTVTGRQEARTPSLDEVKARVRDDVIKQKAIATAREKAAAAEPQLKGKDFSAAAKAAGAEVTTTEPITRGVPIGTLGTLPAVDNVAFSLPAGAVSDPITTDNGAVVVKVLEKTEVTPEELTKGRETLREELLGQRRNQFFSAYMAKARQRMRINVNQAAVAQLFT